MEEELTRDEPMRTAVAETLVRLRAAGIELEANEDPEQLVVLLEAVERFEDAVRRRGGDLMVDEPPRGREPEPDDPRFVLPARTDDETLPQFAKRIRSAAAALEQRGSAPNM
jgi:hypothetical protein